MGKNPKIKDNTRKHNLHSENSVLKLKQLSIKKCEMKLKLHLEKRMSGHS